MPFHLNIFKGMRVTWLIKVLIGCSCLSLMSVKDTEQWTTPNKLLKQKQTNKNFQKKKT